MVVEQEFFFALFSRNGYTLDVVLFVEGLNVGSQIWFAVNHFVLNSCQPGEPIFRGSC